MTVLTVTPLDKPSIGFGFGGISGIDPLTARNLNRWTSWENHPQIVQDIARCIIAELVRSQTTLRFDDDNSGDHRQHQR
jgi:hypothetical protein